MFRSIFGFSQTQEDITQDWLNQVLRIERDKANYGVQSRIHIQAVACKVIDPLGKVLTSPSVITTQEVAKKIVPLCKKDYRLSHEMLKRVALLMQKDRDVFEPLYWALFSPDVKIPDSSSL